ncbi:MAG: cupin domain-containing protein [Thermovirgaceae bacterium]|jgi:quercetin dioxygenase-like cupin family protein|nr:cupin domain-containing protein [Synergistales bacterium]MDI9391684.1 cupin domain-containing protein [Synergistota bacterium]MDY0179007.1 cupin domain-containing protein [Synergistaceae bacterium]HRW86931.1 cupin domain-containing protein [Thermovirgaceae bacterium]MDD3133195.1 cupin domain-containing protein [Synergistales bacterium]
MEYTDTNSLVPKEVVKGVHGKFVHSPHMTMAWWHIEEGAMLPEHSHEHEQVVNVIEGTLEISSGGKKWTLGPGSVLAIPSGVPHLARGVTECRVIDAFYPAREDYK